MNSRELVGIALQNIGVTTTGIENQSGNQFNVNFGRLKRLISGLRLASPYFTQRDLQFSELLSSPFISVDQVVASLNFETNVLYDLEPWTIVEWNQNRVLKKIGGIPCAFYFQKPNSIYVYPPNEDYLYRVWGQINVADGLLPNDDLEQLGVTDFQEDYFIWELSRQLCVPYQKAWTQEMKQNLELAKKNLKNNSQSSARIVYPDVDNSLLYRPRNYDNGS